MRHARSAALLATIASSLLWTGAWAGDEDPTGGARVTAHKIEVSFDLRAHAVSGTDELALDTRTGTTFEFWLPLENVETEKILVTDVTPQGTSSARDESPVLTKLGDGRYRVRVRDGVSSVAITYSGVIFDAVQKKDDLSWVVGDATKGIISEKGIYLSGGSGWYPQVAGETLARFDVTALVPEPLLVVTQGGVPERSTETIDGVKYAKCVARAVMPTDGCDLVAGPYKVLTESYEGLQLSTYFLEGEAGDAPIWMSSLKDVVRRYEGLLGTYPHPKFDVVENFFATGYGMPSFTLLGDSVIQYVTAGAKAPGGKIPPGYLDHEYVHGWFGNGLFVDPKDGNWCEALTTYLSNYYAKELESPDAAREHRRGVLEHYAIRVKPENDYPVREFRTKTEDKDNDVGYGKGSMIFHMLRKRLGDERFFAAVKSTCEKRVGTYVSWKDWLEALDGEWVRPWLERKGLPAVRLASATAWPTSPYPRVVRCEAVIDAPRGSEPWPAFDVPVSVDGKPLGAVRIEGGRGVARFDGGGSAPAVLELDPDYDVLRGIADDDLPACLNRTLEGKGVVVDADDVKPLKDLAERFAKEKGLVPGDDAAAIAAKKPFVWLHVKPGGEALITGRKGASLAMPGGASTVHIGDKTFTGDDLSVLVSSLRDGVPETWFIAMSDAAAARARYVTYYGWDQYVVFKAGQRTPLARGFLDRDPRGTRRAVLVGDGDAQRVDDDVRKIAGGEYGVRRAVRNGSNLTPDEYAGPKGPFRPPAPRIPPFPDRTWTGEPFRVAVPDLVSSRDLVLTTESGAKEVIKNAFRPLFNSPSRESGTPLPFAEGAGAVPAPGKIADTSPEGLSTYGRMVASGISPALLVAPTPAARKALAPFLDAPNVLTPETTAEFAKTGRHGHARRPAQYAPAIAARRTRGWPDAEELRVPVLVLEEGVDERLWAKPKVTHIDFAIAHGPAVGICTNYVTTAVAPPAGERPPIVVVSAHYDSWGADGDVVFPGADDNGSGVACLLECLRGLTPEVVPEKPKTGVIFALFDAEEWGLQGSRVAVKSLAEKYDVKAVVNVDAIGRVRDDTVYVLGLSTHPDLAAKAKDALATSGLKLGRDIDKFGYEEGSDHWPFHQAGIPAITLWASDYATMDTPDDTPDKVDPVGVARIAKALQRLVVKLATE